jgi:acylphosphatase
MAKAAHIVYNGDVQGVGFRYTTRHLAGSFAVSGWVRNLPDGTVELLAQGDEDQVTAFLEAVERRMGHHIRGHRLDWREADASVAGFSVRY